jgi:hypothetical protein
VFKGLADSIGAHCNRNAGKWRLRLRMIGLLRGR